MSARQPVPVVVWLLLGALAVVVAVAPATIPLLFTPRHCAESATLPEVAVPVSCAPPSVVSVRDSEHGPVVLCLCPTLTDGDDVPAEWEGTSAQTEGM